MRFLLLLCTAPAWILGRLNGIIRRHGVPFYFHLNTTLLTIGRERLTFYDFFSGVSVTGGPGAGKSSTMQPYTLKALACSGAGGVIGCIKVGEAASVKNILKRAGRARDIIEITAHGPYRLNIFDYMMATVGASGLTTALVDLMDVVSEACNAADTNSGDGDNGRFFRLAAREFYAHMFVLLHAAYGRIRIKDMYTFMQSLPESVAQTRDPDWHATSFAAKTLVIVGHKAKEHGDAIAEKAVDQSGDYIVSQIATLGEKTRSSLVTSMTAQIYPLAHGPLAELFGTDTTIVPDQTRLGDIFILNLPVRTLGAGAVIAQQLFFYLHNVSVERYPVKRTTRPVFSWIDEAPFLVNSHTVEAAAVARESKHAIVLLAQDHTAYHAKLVGDGEHLAATLLAKMQTRIAFSNTDHTTNTDIANIIGRVKKTHNARSRMKGRSNSSSLNQNEFHGSYAGGSGTNYTDSDSYSEYDSYDVEPHQFAQLKTGGTLHRRVVTGFLVRAGREWQQNHRKHWIPIKAKQR